MGCGASLPGESTGPAPRFIGEELRAHCLASLARGSSWAPAALDALPHDKYGALIGDDAGAAAGAVALRAGLLAKACVNPEELVGAASSIGADLARLGAPLSAVGDGVSAMRSALTGLSRPEAAAWEQLYKDAAPLVLKALVAGRPKIAAPPWAVSVQHCQRTWSTVSLDLGEAGSMAYKAMFSADPSTLKLFVFRESAPHFSDGRLKTHVRKTFGVVGRILMAIPASGDTTELRRNIERIGGSHGHKGITGVMLDAFSAPLYTEGFAFPTSHRCLMKTPSATDLGFMTMLPTVLGDEFTPEVEASWRSVLTEIKRLFIGGLQLWKAGGMPDAAITGCAPPEFRIKGDYVLN